MTNSMSDLKMKLHKLKLFGIVYTVVDQLVEHGLVDKELKWLAATRRFTNTRPDRYPALISEYYYTQTGEKLDLERPATYNEKIQWLKVHDTTELKKKLADKYECREWVADRIGSKYLINLIGAWDNFDDIDFDLLPPKFALKCSHGSGMNIIVTDKEKLDLKDAKKKINRWMKTDFSCVYGFELQYHETHHRIIAEEYIENGGEDLYDYKFWYNNGKLDFIILMEDRKHGLAVSYYDPDWNRMDTIDDPHPGKGVERPDNLDEMIEISRKLAEGFYHVRVDLYRLDDGTIKFGEMTFSSATGTRKWEPEGVDLMLGGHIKLPTDEPDGK